MTGPLLQVAIAGNGDTAEAIGQLRQPRAVDARPRIAAPQIGRAQKALGHRHRVSCPIPQGPQMRGGDEALGGLAPFLAGGQHGHAGAQRQAGQLERLHTRFGVKMGRGGRDPVGRPCRVGQRGLIQPAAMAVLHCETEGVGALAVDHGETFAQEKLTVARAAGGDTEVGQRRRDMQEFPLGIGGRLQLAAKRDMGDARRRRGQAAVHFTAPAWQERRPTAPVPPAPHRPWAGRAGRRASGHRCQSACSAGLRQSGAGTGPP